MALDIYVGGFARYYAKEWENVMQKYARENGEGYAIFHAPDGEAPETSDWGEVERCNQPYIR